MRELKPSTWFGEQLLQGWGHWCIQYLETFGSGGGAQAGGDSDRRSTRAPGDHSDPVLAELISTEIAHALNQTLHLQIAETKQLDRRVAMLRYVGKPLKLPEFGGEAVIWRGVIEIGGGVKATLEFPEPQMLRAVCVPQDPNPASIGRELGVSAEDVREATRRLRTLAVKTYRRVNARSRKAA